MATADIKIRIGNLDFLAEQMHTLSREKGFWEDGYSDAVLGQKLALIHSEVTEILEAIRKDEGDDAVVEEIADTIIRLLDFYAAYGRRRMIEDLTAIPGLDDKLKAKHAKNGERPQKHGNRF